MMTEEGYTKIVNFMILGAGVLTLQHGHISHCSEYVLSSTLSIYSILIAIVLRDYDTDFLYHCCFFFLFYDEVFDMQIKSHLTRSHCTVSDTHMTIKDCGPLVFVSNHTT